MIYMSLSNGQRVIILDHHNIDGLKAGTPASTDDRHVLIAYTPDIPWLTEELLKLGQELNPFKLEALLKEGLTRPDAPKPPYHPRINVYDKKGEA